MPRRCIPDGCPIRSQKPLALDERSEPEPDIAVVPGQLRDYAQSHPATALLIVEVADSSLAYDRTDNDRYPISERNEAIWLRLLGKELSSAG